jgi:hypothetical protein
MVRRLLVALYYSPAIAFPLCAQNSPLALCIVESKLNPEIQYDPSAGPLAIEMHNQLSGQKLLNGSSLKITVLPASVQKDILPEIGRLQCSWVLQLWRTRSSSYSYQSPVVLYQDIYFSLWNGATRKTIAKGIALFPVPNPRNSLSHPTKDSDPAADVAKKVLNSLNKLH